MKRAAIAAIAALTIAGMATTAIGEGVVKINLGGEQLSVDLPSSVVGSVQEIVYKLGAFPKYSKETGILKIDKPMVNMLILAGIQQTRNGDIVFSNPIRRWVDKDIPRNFGVFVEIDNAPVSKELTLKVVLVGPSGKIVASSKERTFTTTNETSFYFSEPFISTKLDQFGTYKVQLHMKQDKISPYVIVGENSFTVGR